MVLHHLVYPDNAYRIHKPFGITLSPRAPWCRIFWSLVAKGILLFFIIISIHFFLTMNRFNAQIHHSLKFGKELIIVLLCPVRSPRAVKRDYLPRAHREVFAILEIQLIFKIIVLFWDDEKLYAQHW